MPEISTWDRSKRINTYLEIAVRSNAESVARTTKIIRHTNGQKRHGQNIGRIVSGSNEEEEETMTQESERETYLVMKPTVP